MILCHLQTNVKHIKGEITHDLIPACDLSLCYYLSMHGCDLIAEDDLFSHSNHIGKPCHEGYFEFRDNRNIISCHNMSLSDFDDYTKILQTKA